MDPLDSSTEFVVSMLILDMIIGSVIGALFFVRDPHILWGRIIIIELIGLLLATILLIILPYRFPDVSFRHVLEKTWRQMTFRDPLSKICWPIVASALIILGFFLKRRHNPKEPAQQGGFHFDPEKVFPIQDGGCAPRSIAFSLDPAAYINHINQTTKDKTMDPVYRIINHHIKGPPITQSQRQRYNNDMNANQFLEQISQKLGRSIRVKYLSQGQQQPTLDQYIIGHHEDPLTVIYRPDPNGHGGHFDGYRT